MTEDKAQHFIRQMIATDVASGKHDGRVQTRFPPEPNGYLHIGHAKAICLDFGMAAEFGGLCNLRFDDTNPVKEDIEYVEAIKEDVRWLGFEWAQECYASDYFEQLYQFAEKLIQDGKAYVCDLDAQQMREHRGTLTEPGRESPYRCRSIDENLDLFRRMRAGEYPDGTRTLRAKIDMAHPNLNMRDPVMYRIKRAHHDRTGDKWCIYPSYDFTHGQSDSIEQVTHSLCTLEFESHRPLYDWFIENLSIFPSRQTEFARLNLTYTIMSKRKLLQLVEEKHVSGWDDPRMPTLSGMRRRGYPAAALRAFCETIGITKYNATTDIALLEHAVREELNRTAPRRMAVLKPLELVITNWPQDQTAHIEAINNPEDPSAGTRTLPFGKHLLIEQEDFQEDAGKKFFRLKPGGEVRLRHAYIIRCDEVEKDSTGQVTRLHCTADMDTLGRQPEDRKVKGVIHWVSAPHALQAEVRLFDRLFTVEKPDADKERPFTDFLNPNSLQTITGHLEPSLSDAPAGEPVQFERIGYFCADRREHQPGTRAVFNRTVPLRDSWNKSSGQ